MRRGFHAVVMYNERNQLMALATGSDACAEHEVGSRPVMEALTTQYEGREALLKALRNNEAVGYPQLLECKRVSKSLDRIQFVEVPGNGTKPPEAVLAFGPGTVDPEYRELRFWEKSGGDSAWDTDIVGAWCDRAFAFHVRGEKYCALLREFYEAMRAGKALFAGTFLPRREATGVVLAITERLDRAARAKVREAQREFERKLRLDARDDSQVVASEVRRLLKAAGRREPHVGFFWAVWADSKDESKGIAYALNPGSGINAEYRGPYTKEQLYDWARTGMAYPLRPLARAA